MSGDDSKIIEYLTDQNVKLNSEIDNLKCRVEKLEEFINKIQSNSMIESSKQFVKKENSNLNINIKQYKKSLLIEGDTIPCKQILKELGAKWTNGENCKGWMFIGVLKESDEIEQKSKFIIDKLEENNFKVIVTYNN